MAIILATVNYLIVKEYPKQRKIWEQSVAGAEKDVETVIVASSTTATAATMSTKTEPEQKSIAKPTKRCPYCGEEILAVAKKCKHCGEWLNK